METKARQDQRRGQHAEGPGHKPGILRVRGPRRARHFCSPRPSRGKHPTLAAAAEYPLSYDGGDSAIHVSDGAGLTREVAVRDETQEGSCEEACRALRLEGGAQELQDLLASLVLSECVYKKLETTEEGVATRIAEYVAQFPPGWVELEAVQLTQEGITQHYLIATGGGCMYLAFMGTKRWEDIVTDAKLLHTPVWAEAARLAADEQSIPAAHRGFLERARAIPIEQLYDLASKRGLRLVLCGHSLGGAVAKLCTLRLLRELPDWPRPRVHCIAFATPAVGNAALAEMVESAGWGSHFSTYYLPEDQLVRLISFSQARPSAAGRRRKGRKGASSAAGEAGAATVSTLGSLDSVDAGGEAHGVEAEQSLAGGVVGTITRSGAQQRLAASSSGRSAEVASSFGGSTASSVCDGELSGSIGAASSDVGEDMWGALPRRSLFGRFARSWSGGLSRCTSAASFGPAATPDGLPSVCSRSSSETADRAAALGAGQLPHLPSAPATPCPAAATAAAVMAAVASISKDSLDEERAGAAMDEILLSPTTTPAPAPLTSSAGDAAASASAAAAGACAAAAAASAPGAAAAGAAAASLTVDEVANNEGDPTDLAAAQRRALSGAWGGGSWGLKLALQRRRVMRRVRQAAARAHIPLPKALLPVSSFHAFGQQWFITEHGALTPEELLARQPAQSAEPPDGARGFFSFHRMLAYRYRHIDLIRRLGSTASAAAAASAEGVLPASSAAHPAVRRASHEASSPDSAPTPSKPSPLPLRTAVSAPGTLSTRVALASAAEVRDPAGAGAGGGPCAAAREQVRAAAPAAIVPVVDVLPRIMVHSAVLRATAQCREVPSSTAAGAATSSSGAAAAHSRPAAAAGRDRDRGAAGAWWSRAGSQSAASSSVAAGEAATAPAGGGAATPGGVAKAAHAGALPASRGGARDSVQLELEVEGNNLQFCRHVSVTLLPYGAPDGANRPEGTGPGAPAAPAAGTGAAGVSGAGGSSGGGSEVPCEVVRVLYTPLPCSAQDLLSPAPLQQPASRLCNTLQNITGSLIGRVWWQAQNRAGCKLAAAAAARVAGAAAAATAGPRAVLRRFPLPLRSRGRGSSLADGARGEEEDEAFWDASSSSNSDAESERCAAPGSCFASTRRCSPAAAPTPSTPSRLILRVTLPRGVAAGLLDGTLAPHAHLGVSARSDFHTVSAVPVRVQRQRVAVIGTSAYAASLMQAVLLAPTVVAAAAAGRAGREGRAAGAGSAAWGWLPVPPQLLRVLSSVGKSRASADDTAAAADAASAATPAGAGQPADSQPTWVAPMQALLAALLHKGRAAQAADGSSSVAAGPSERGGDVPGASTRAEAQAEAQASHVLGWLPARKKQQASASPADGAGAGDGAADALPRARWGQPSSLPGRMQWALRQSLAVAVVGFAAAMSSGGVGVTAAAGATAAVAGAAGMALLSFVSHAGPEGGGLIGQAMLGAAAAAAAAAAATTAAVASDVEATLGAIMAGMAAAAVAAAASVPIGLGSAATLAAARGSAYTQTTSAVAHSPPAPALTDAGDAARGGGTLRNTALYAAELASPRPLVPPPLGPSPRAPRLSVIAPPAGPPRVAASAAHSAATASESAPAAGTSPPVPQPRPLPRAQQPRWALRLVPPRAGAPGQGAARPLGGGWWLWRQAAGASDPRDGDSNRGQKGSGAGVGGSSSSGAAPPPQPRQPRWPWSADGRPVARMDEQAGQQGVPSSSSPVGPAAAAATAAGVRSSPAARGVGRGGGAGGMAAAASADAETGAVLQRQQSHGAGAWGRRGGALGPAPLVAPSLTDSPHPAVPAAAAQAAAGPAAALPGWFRAPAPLLVPVDLAAQVQPPSGSAHAGPAAAASTPAARLAPLAAQLGKLQWRLPQLALPRGPGRAVLPIPPTVAAEGLEVCNVMLDMRRVLPRGPGSAPGGVLGKADAAGTHHTAAACASTPAVPAAKLWPGGHSSASSIMRLAAAPATPPSTPRAAEAASGAAAAASAPASGAAAGPAKVAAPSAAEAAKAMSQAVEAFAATVAAGARGAVPHRVGVAPAVAVRRMSDGLYQQVLRRQLQQLQMLPAGWWHWLVGGVVGALRGPAALVGGMLGHLPLWGLAGLRRSSRAAGAAAPPPGAAPAPPAASAGGARAAAAGLVEGVASVPGQGAAARLGAGQEEWGAVLLVASCRDPLHVLRGRALAAMRSRAAAALCPLVPVLLTCAATPAARRSTALRALAAACGVEPSAVRVVRVEDWLLHQPAVAISHLDMGAVWRSAVECEGAEQLRAELRTAVEAAAAERAAAVAMGGTWEVAAMVGSTGAAASAGKA